MKSFALIGIIYLKKRRRKMRNIIIIFCCLMLLPFQMLTASAQAKLENLAVESSGLPDNAVYMDMLISMDENDEAYTPFNKENMKQYSFDTKTIADYNSEGFVSMSYHYKDNLTRMKIQTDVRGDYINSFTLKRRSDGNIYSNYQLVYNLLKEDRQFRIALLDENGGIIQISKPFGITGRKGDLLGYIKYNAEHNKLSLNYEYSGAPLWWVRAVNPLYIIGGIIVIIVVIKFLISRLRHRHSNID